MAYRLAVASPRITATAIEATEFPDLAKTYRVSGVPKTVIDGRIEILGAQSEDVLVAQLVQ